MAKTILFHLFLVVTILKSAAALCDYTTCDECKVAGCKWCSDGCHTFMSTCTGAAACTANCSALNAINMQSSYCWPMTGCSGVTIDDEGACSMKDPNGVARAIAEWCYCAPGYSRKNATTCYLDSHGPAFLGVSPTPTPCIQNDIPCPWPCIHGQCNRMVGECACETGWTGSACNTPICISDCNNHGTCVSPGTCECNEHWATPLCSSCVTGWTGIACDTPICTTNCSGHGYCTGPELCVCDLNWKGTSTCSSCTPGWYGEQCNWYSEDEGSSSTITIFFITNFVLFFMRIL